MVRRAFVHHHGRAGGQRSIDGVTVACHPSDIGGAPVDIVGLDIENPLHRHQDVGQIATGGVHDSLRFAGRAGGVESIERMLGIERGGRAVRALARDDFVPPEVAARFHLDRDADALQHQHFFDRRTLLKCFIDVALELDMRAPAPSGVGGDTDLSLGVVDSVGKRLGGKSTEDHRMNRADSRAREHRDRRLWHQRHINRDPVAVLDPQLFERIGGARDFVGQHLIGQHARVAGLALKNNRGLVAVCAAQMTIEAVVGGVDFSANEPFCIWKLPFQDFARTARTNRDSWRIRPRRLPDSPRHGRIARRIRRDS